MDSLARRFDTGLGPLWQSQLVLNVGWALAPIILGYNAWKAMRVDGSGPQPFQYRNPFLTASTRIFSKLSAVASKWQIPPPFNEKFFRFYCLLFGANSAEAEFPLHRYTSLSHFFTRRLLPGSRTIAHDSPLVSPCDGTLLAFGEVVDGHIPQIKGHSFPESEFLLSTPGAERLRIAEDGSLRANVVGESCEENTKRMYCVIYLDPGDYHRFHSPTNFSVRGLSHVPGTLHPVHGLSRRIVPWLFCQNERVVMEGQWEHGQFAMAAVAAFGVGDIHLNHDPAIACNKWEDLRAAADVLATARRTDYEEPISFTHGEDMGHFTFGSTIVLVFDAPHDFQFGVNKGRVVMGEALASA